MFDFIRTHSKVVMFVLFLLVVPSFVLLGTGNNRPNEKGTVVATVNGKDITQSDWDLAHENEARRVRATNPTVDPKLLDSPQAKYATLESIVRERVLAAAMDKAHLVASDQRLASELQQVPVIAALRKPDGTLDMERYKQLAASEGLTPEMFEARVRRDLSVQQVLGGVTDSGLVARGVADLAITPFFERREVRLARFKTEDYLKKVSPTQADIEAFYRANEGQFRSPEQADVEYVVLDVDAVKKSITVNEQDLKTYYEQNAARLAGKEERRASHILIAAGKDAPAAERTKARAKAEELLAAVRKAPQTFADVAKRSSQDPGSAAAGGDLDFFSRGAMTKPFEDAVFAMNKGDISDLVETEFGYHIIRVTDVRAPKQKSFEELKPSLEEDFRKQQATAKFAEAAEVFTNMVYEQSDSLKAVAARLKLNIQQAQGLGRSGTPDAKGPLANRNFLNALFSPDTTEKKRNTEAIEIGPNQLAAGRITAYRPAAVLPLAEVQDRVRARVLNNMAADMARVEGKAKLVAWQSNPASAALPETQQVSREQSSLPRALVQAALRADGDKLPQLLGVDLGAEGYAVVSVEKRVPRATVEADRARNELNQYTTSWGTAEGQAYYDLLKARFKVKFKVAPPSLIEASSALQRGL